jgi:hypothetical protein
MVLIKEQINQEYWFAEQLSKLIPTDYISCEVVNFVEEHVDDILDKNEWKPKYSVKTLLKILIYASVDCVTSTERIYEYL